MSRQLILELRVMQVNLLLLKLTIGMKIRCDINGLFSRARELLWDESYYAWLIANFITQKELNMINPSF